VSRPALVLRPAPGDRATVARLEPAGLVAIRLPLFQIVPLPWVPPVGEHDALLLTSANAVRHAGPGLEALRGLPAIAVGKATAEAARAAGLQVVATGQDDGLAALALAHARGWRRVVRLAGREPTPLDGVTDLMVYASEPSHVPGGALAVARGAVALLHSARAAARFAALVDRDGVSRDAVRLAAISAKVVAAAGPDWGATRVADAPCDAALVAAAMTLAIDP
jgi:uroporphyrinogen-III synthase